MKIHPAPQNSLEWLQARAGIPTASEFGELITPELKIRTGETPKTYIARKLAEKWVGGPLPGFGTLDMEFGKILEDEALPWFQLETGIEVQRVGLCLTDDGRVGCSPDGLIGDNSGIEIKCPAPHTHVKYLLGNVLPKEYVLQVHGSMYVTGRSSWRFLSYCRNYPALLIDVKKEESVQDVIEIALNVFFEAFNNGWSRLCSINGGTPQQSARTVRVEEPKVNGPKWIDEDEKEIIP